MTADVVWWVAGTGAVVIGLYILLLVFTTRLDRWPLGDSQAPGRARRRRRTLRQTRQGRCERAVDIRPARLPANDALNADS